MDPARLFGNSVGMLTVPWLTAPRLTARETAALILDSVGVRAPIFRAPIYGSCQTIWEFRWHVDRPLVDGAKVDGTGNSRPDLGGGQSAFLPRFSGPMSAGVGSGLGRLWGIPVGNWLGRVARRAEVDSRIRAGRLCAGDGIVCGCGSDIGAGAASADRGGSDLVGVAGLRRDAAAVFSGFAGFAVFSRFEDPRAGVGCSLPADCGRGSHPTGA